MKALQLYEEQLRRSSEDVPDDKKLKFGDHWIEGWMAEFNVSLRLPNKRFVLPMDVRKQRMIDFIKNVLRVRVWFKRVVGVDIPIVNMDQMPLHRNETSGQKTLTICDQDTVVKQNYHLTRERITCMTILSSKDGAISPHYVFKGKGTHLQEKLKRPPGVVTLWSAKGSYRVETMVETIRHLPNLTRHDALPGRTFKEWQLMLLDDYSVHVTSEVRQELLKRGYVLVVLGGGITGDVQINDTHLHHRLKSVYRKKETELMMEQLEARPDRVPSPSRDDVMAMLQDSLSALNFDVLGALKENFIANALDGSEDLLVRDKIFSMIGADITEFRQQLMEAPIRRQMKQMLATITPPDGVRRKTLRVDEAPDDEGHELLDAEDGEEEILNLSLEEEEGREDVQCEQQHSTDPPSPVIPVNVTSRGDHILPTDLDDTALNTDARFLNELGELLGKYGKLTSRRFIPTMLQLNATYVKGRRAMKKRIGIGHQVKEIHQLPPASDDCPENTDIATAENDTPQQPEQHAAVAVGDYVLVSHGRHNIPACIVRSGEEGLAVKYFDHVRDNLYTCQDIPYEIIQDDILRHIPAPDLRQETKSRFFYVFSI